MFKYFPHTPDDIRRMLDVIGLNTLDDLYADVPESVKMQNPYHLPGSMSEQEMRRHFNHLGQLNKPLICFAGAGTYDHYIPSVIPQICSRAEYLTSYTPYQAEIAQGTLHYIFEFQTMMSRLTGLPVSNASLYDGSTATAEAMMMAQANSKKSRRILVSDTVDHKVLDVLQTYAHWQDTEVVVVPQADGITNKPEMMNELANGGAAGIIVQQPNRYGLVEDFSGLADAAHHAKALFIINSVIADLALLRTPGEWGADIAVGEAQSLGLPMAWGGPYIGYMCCTEKLMRKMPGRIVGQTVDEDGQRAYVLTLQAREQHIRRQKATSNICSNQSLMVLWATLYLSLMGKQGLQEVAQIGVDGAHYLKQQLINTKKFTDPYPKHEYFNEFCLQYKGCARDLLKHWCEHGFLGGVEMEDNKIVIAVTEQRTKAECDKLVALINGNF